MNERIADSSRSLRLVSSCALDSKVDKEAAGSCDLRNSVSSGGTPFLLVWEDTSSRMQHNKMTVPSVPVQATSCKQEISFGQDFALPDHDKKQRLTRVLHCRLSVASSPEAGRLLPWLGYSVLCDPGVKKLVQQVCMLRVSANRTCPP